MKRWYKIGGITLLAIILLFSQVMAFSVERTIVPGENATYLVILNLPEETVAGISESIPAGYGFYEVLIPPTQYRIDGRTLHIAVLGEKNVSYIVKGKENPIREISGVWTDFVTGESGRVNDSGKYSPSSESGGENENPAKAGKAGSAPVVSCIMATVALLGALKIIGRRQCLK